MSKTDSTSIYSAHPSLKMIQKWIIDLPEKTGRTLDEWVELVEHEGPKGGKERRQWLRTEYSLNMPTAWCIVDHMEGDLWLGGDDEAYLNLAEKYVDDMFAGPKSAMKPIADELFKFVKTLGSDVKICPCKTIVPFYRNHVFAEVKPATQKRVDFGLALKGVTKKIPARLVDTGGLAKKDRITHCFKILSVQDIDEELKEWLTIAYELDCK